MYIEYRVDLGSNIWKKGRKTHILGKFRDLYRYTFEPVLVQLLQNRTLTGTCQSCTGTDCSILTSIRILAITWSFIIQFE